MNFLFFFWRPAIYVTSLCYCFMFMLLANKLMMMMMMMRDHNTFCVVFNSRKNVITRHRASTSMYSLFANILRSLFVARTPPVEASSPDCRSNVENAPRRRPAARFPYAARGFGGAPRRPLVAGRRRAQTPPSRPFALCRHIAGWTQACN